MSTENLNSKVKKKSCNASKETQTLTSDTDDESGIDWTKIPHDGENLRFRRDISTDEYTHKWMSKWRKDAFQPPFTGCTDFLTLGSFVETANNEVIGAMKVWVEQNLILFDKIEKAVGGREISRMAFVDQRLYANYIGKTIVGWMKTVKNIPIRVLNDEMLLMLLMDPPDDEKHKKTYWLSQTVNLVKNMARSKVFKLRFVPFQDKRNFEIATMWPEYEDQARPYGKLEVWDYGNDDGFNNHDDFISAAE